MSTIPPEFLAELQDTAERAAKGLITSVERDEACKNMDRIREEIRKKHGILDIGVPAIRELRDE